MFFKAITHATDEKGWDVDIIVLSLGFDEENEPIRRAISQASSHPRDKLVFAAASNLSTGSMDQSQRVCFPARMDGVFSIRSADGHGTLVDSPNRTYATDNFSVLGAGLEAAWPLDLNNQRETKSVSGTSFATPIAAGIAAIVLEYSIQKECDDARLQTLWRQRLGRFSGMKKIFQEMSSHNDDSDCPGHKRSFIRPHELFRRDTGDHEELIVWRITNALKSL